ncbi:MAG: hypothetical protein IJZ69_05640 [Bacteroidales bacterium]|nr:hypothetical protein [Bacteroidales bacterium]
MKRFFIFAAMLAALTLRAADTQDDPPVVLPSPESIILIPQDMFDIDRSLALCEYTCDIVNGAVYVTCHGTGSQTELYLLDNTGRVIDMTTVDSEITQDATLYSSLTPGTYRIVLDSEKYHGEDTFTIR